MAKKNMTMDNLAMMVQEGFMGLEDKMNKRFDMVDERLNHIEDIILDQHRERINRLEDQVKELQADFRSLVGRK